MFNLHPHVVRAIFQEAKKLSHKNKTILNDQLGKFLMNHESEFGIAINKVNIAKIYNNPLPPQRPQRGALVGQFCTTRFEFALHQMDPRSEGDGAIIERIRSKLHEQSDSPTVDASGRQNLQNALHLLLGVRQAEVEQSKRFDGEYFGYRRSTHEGEIIRFYIKIFYDDASHIIRFENFYRRLNTRWVVRGFGLSVDGILYLIGHARAEDERVGLGIRCFAVTRFASTWWVGPVLSVDGNLIPLAARIVLIPTAEHRIESSRVNELSMEQKKDMLERKDSADMRNELNRMLQVPGYPTASDYIEHIIRNGTLTTLSGRPVEVIDRRQIIDKELEIVERASWMHVSPDILYFNMLTDYLNNRPETPPQG
jgi:hypothetical protein